MMIVGICEICGIAISAETSQYAWFQTKLWQQGKNGRVAFASAQRTGKVRCSACGPAGVGSSEKQKALF